MARKKKMTTPPSPDPGFTATVVPHSQLDDSQTGNTQGKRTREDQSFAAAHAYAWCKGHSSMPNRHSLPPVWKRVAAAAREVGCPPDTYVVFHVLHSGRTFWTNQLATHEFKDKFRQWLENRRQIIHDIVISSESALESQAQTSYSMWMGTGVTLEDCRKGSISSRLVGVAPVWKCAKAFDLGVQEVVDKYTLPARLEFGLASEAWSQELKAAGISDEAIQYIKQERTPAYGQWI